MRSLAEQLFCRHDHSVGAVPALGRLLSDERGLHRIGFLRRTRSFYRCDRVSFCLLDGGDAGTVRFPIDQYRTRSTLSEPASEFRTVQAHRIPKNIEQRLRWIPRLHCHSAAINPEFEVRHLSSLSQLGQSPIKTAIHVQLLPMELFSQHLSDLISGGVYDRRSSAHEIA